MLFVESILHVRGWTISDWNNIYVNTPSRQLTVQVPDRTVVIPNDTERAVLGPAGLQEAIDALVEKAESPARAFVRPSGTEDIVRVYAEAKTQDGADKLAQAVSEAVSKFAGGGNKNDDSTGSDQKSAGGDDVSSKTADTSSKM
jgi:phosphoacetylglucosamine mutase